jgi:predicted MFS family arabinose efflux permease
MRSPSAAVARSGDPLLPAGLVAAFASACGLAVASIYYAQPLIGFIAPELRLAPALAGLLMTLTQAGYGAGLLLLVPLSDVFENRRLALALLAGLALALLAVSRAPSAPLFLAASFVAGALAAATQILVPFASHLAPEERRGRVVGQVMAGLLAGIMLARPAASFAAGRLGWRAVFSGAALAILGTVLLLRRMLPRRVPTGGIGYLQGLRSLPALLARTPVLRRRALYQSMMFSGFCLFWTAAPLVLVRRFGLSHDGIAWFALAGAGGACAAPFAGWLADHGHGRAGTGWALGSVALAFALAAWAVARHALALLVVAGVLLDAAVQVSQVIGLRAIYLLAPEARGRMNGLFIALTFVSGAVASGFAPAIHEAAGFGAVCLVGAACAFVALGGLTTERSGPARPRTAD